MEDSQTGLGSLRPQSLGTPDPTQHVGRGGRCGAGGMGKQVPRAPCWLLPGYPPLPWIQGDHNSQQPHGQQAPYTEDSCASRPYGSWSPRHPETDKFSGQGMWQAWVSSTPL